MSQNAETPDPLDAIVAALGLLRGRGPRPPREHAHGGRGFHGHGGPHGEHGEPHGGRRGAEPWAGGPWGGTRGEAPARVRMLEALAAGPLSVSALGEAIGVDQPRASRLVQQGVERGWLRREADPDDARRTRIVLTDEGRRLGRGVRGDRREALRRAMSALTAEEQAEFARLLAKVAENWR
ncbi:MarR family winged helix-turn-helix transcriptional regulator [Microbacterium azadirachtae]|uniref:MarR family winged helix-turn-helix transcriptional regulator n=1 Tax=Microbacterium azadirachtae TaxID=582680 RepID=UPI0021D4E716|nr:MarR family winged helix-turn-helix transcriptional regulator [Microbacterium azadirachtae]UXW85738.1 MarR family winged helix-turn-helix transcriptional regulator [Microbacterium azadirachtae]